MLTFGSVCSGIEAASVAWAGFDAKPSWFAEIEAFPSSVLAHHYPDVPNLGDMTRIAELVSAGVLDAPDVLVGGTPCQSFSLAGLRAGLSDPRGGLTLAFVELADAIDGVRDEPCVVVWENVPGVLSSKDNAFGCFLAGLAGEDEPLIPAGSKWSNAGVVLGPKRAIAWRILDAQYFGVAQRRRRVFVVASARDGFDPAAVLFEFEGVRRDIAPWIEHRSAEYSASAPQCAFDMLGFGQYGEGVTASTCKARDYKDATDLVVTNSGRVRRLTPVEHERLQGFPRGYTDVSWYECCGLKFHKSLGKYGCPNCQGETVAWLKRAKDGPRYKALGNSMAVPVMQWIGKRVFDAMQRDTLI